MLFECYTKFTFGIVAIGFVFANACVSSYNRQVSLRCLGIIAFTATALEATFHFHAAYVANVKGFISWVQARNRIWDATKIFIADAPITLCAIGVALAPKALGRQNRWDMIFALGCVLACVLLRMGIGDGGVGLIGLVAVFFVMGELARRAAEKRGDLDRSLFGPQFIAIACLFLGVVFSATDSMGRVIVLADYTTHIVLRGASPNPPPKLAGFVVRPPPEYKFALGPLEAAEYMELIADGTSLLKSIAEPDRSVFTFDVVNPFPYTADMRPPLGGWPQFFIGKPYTTDPNILPSPDRLLGNVDYVMVPKHTDRQRYLMMKLYGPALREKYQLLKTSLYWDLWMRKTG